MRRKGRWHGGSALRGVAWLSLGEGVQRVLALVLFAYLSRKVSVEQNGWYGLWAAATPLFIVIINAGGSDVLLRDAAAGSPQAGAVRLSLLWTQAIFFAALLAFTRAACQVAGFEPALQAILLAGVAAAWCWTVVRMHLALLMADGRFAQAGVLTAATRLGVVAGALALLYGGYGVWAVCWWVVPVYAGAAFAAWRMSGAPAPTLQRPDKAVLHYALREGIVLAGGGLAATAYYGLDMALLQALVSSQSAGYYALGTRFFLLLMAFPEVITQIIYPLLSRHAAASPPRQAALLARCLKHALGLALPAALGMTLLTGGIVALLAGPRYGPSTLAVTLLTWTWTLETLNWLLVAYLRASGRQRIVLYAYAAAAALKGGLAIYLVPRYGAYTLLALNILLSGGVTAVLFAVSAHRLQGAGLIPRVLAFIPRLSAACLFLAAVVWILRPFPVLIAVIAGLAAYLAALQTFSLFDRRDRVAIRLALGRRTG